MTSIFEKTLEEIDASLDEFCADMKRRIRRDRYARYMQSETWRDLRTLMLDIYGHRCAICSSPDELQVHHLTYDRFGGDELLTDLQVLCKTCHEDAHGRKF